MKTIVIAIFAITYFLIVIRRRHSNIFSWGCVALFLLLGAIRPGDALRAVDVNVLAVFLGPMVLSVLFILSGVPAFLAAHLVRRSKSTLAALLWVCFLSSVISIFVENVATVLIVAPIAFEISKKLKTSPVPLIIGVAISSNLQGCATMIGDPPSIIMAMASGMNFNDFFWMLRRPGVFFAVEIGAIASFFMLYLAFKKFKGRPEEIEEVKVKTWAPTFFIILLIVCLAALSFIKDKPDLSITYVCAGIALLGFLWNILMGREKFSAVRDIDWSTFFFLISVFIIVGTLTKVGIMEDIADLILRVSGSSPFIAYLSIVWISVFASAFVDNIPYTMAMIPVVQLVAGGLGMSQWPFLFGLLIGTCLGGNITPIGASSNIVGVGLLKKENYSVGFLDFIKIGLPFTITAVLASSAFIWLVWAR